MSSPHISSDGSPTAAQWHVFTDFTNEIDLADGSQGPKDVAARVVQALTSGVLVVKRLDGTTETLTVPYPGFQLAGACSAIKKASDGTTVTAVIAYW